MIILLQLHSAYELYLETTEDRQRSEACAQPQGPEESEESEDKDTDDSHPTTSRKAGWFRRERKVPVDPLKLSMRFKQTLSQPDVKVHFVGAWCVRHITWVGIPFNLHWQGHSIVYRLCTESQSS
jgi:hypothetical protein